QQTLSSTAAVVNPSKRAEIIIVDNGSSDNTAEICVGVKKAFPDHRWNYVYEPMPGLLSGRHRGAKEAHGEILAFLDDDVLLAPGWFEALQQAFKDPSIARVGGPSRPHFEVNPPRWLDALRWYPDEGCVLGFLSLIDLGSSIRPCDASLVHGLNYSIRHTA